MIADDRPGSHRAGRCRARRPAHRPLRHPARLPLARPRHTRRVSVYLPPGYDNIRPALSGALPAGRPEPVRSGPRLRTGPGLAARRDGPGADRRGRSSRRDHRRRRSRRRRPHRRVHADARPAPAAGRPARHLSPHAGRRAEAVDRRHATGRGRTPATPASAARRWGARRTRDRPHPARRLRPRRGVVAVAVVGSAPRHRPGARDSRTASRSGSGSTPAPHEGPGRRCTTCGC